MSGFFDELQRRKVYRVAAAYIVAAGFIIQIASAAFPAWELPNWALRLVIALLLIGFPICLILAWAYDVTPQGIKVTPPQSAQTKQRRRNLVMLSATGVLISAAAGFFLLPRASAHKIDKSIAVLPFENLSEEKENAYFADGIQDDILTNLSKIGDIKVISRTSVMSYRAKAPNVREIGKALGVSTILEGSVRREGNRVRVNVQLINATNDEHIWANNYDRELTDVFAIQTDLAQKIASELQAKLSPTEKAQMSQKPTENGEAYLAYIQAMNLFVPEETEKLKQGEQLYERALELDPNFALACARLSHLESWIFHSIDPSPSRRAKARTLAEQALKLQPNLPEAHLALGYCYYYGDLDYDRALSEFKIAQNGLPNDAEVLLSLGAIQRRKGQWAESTAYFEKAASVNPKDAWVLQNLGINYEAVRNYEAAERTFDRGIELSPASFGLRGMKSKLAIDWKGDVSVADRELAKLPPGFDPEGMITEGRVGIFLYERKFAEALALLQKIKGDILHGENGSPTPKGLLEGICYLFMNDKAKAREAMERARVFVEQQLRENPNDAGRHAQLGTIFAALGRKEDAIQEGKRATELLPESKDAFDGPAMTIQLAQIYVWTGEIDQALQLIEHSLTTPAGITAALLKLDPVWDPLRKDPRFQAFIEKYSAKI
ncbi:MAG TPA: tetratricopeptide repeat protein [Chthoniobacterales bacterium]|nr:tetratricopeptide repeat protein [Chthoniobacterales bacterium]